MTVRIATKETTSTVLACKVPVSIYYSNGQIIDRPTTVGGYKSKTLQVYTLTTNGRTTTINEGKYKRLRKQHEKRNRQTPRVIDGYCRIQL